MNVETRSETSKVALLHPRGQRILPSASPSRSGSEVPRRVVVIDNYDSFTYNLVQYLLEGGAIVDIYRNDDVEAAAVIEDRPTHILLSPGPGRPAQSGVCQELCRLLVGQREIPTLGVCLGHQTLCEVHGATVRGADRIMHGKVSPIIHGGRDLFAEIPSPFQATRYHSLIVDEATLPPSLVAVAHTPEGELMAVRHVAAPVFGVQFHPESILSQHGHAMIRNFLAYGAVTDPAGCQASSGGAPP